MNPNTPISFDDLDDASLVPTGKPARELDKAYIDSAARIGIGSRASVEENRNQVAQFDCGKCRGSGKFYSYTGRLVGPCHKCKGTGKLKTDPVRAEKRRAAKAKKVHDEREARAAAWIAEHAAHAAWIEANAGRFDFARAMRDAVNQYGSLTSAQFAAIDRCMQKDVQRAKERAERKPDANVAGEGFSRMLTAFATARVSGLKSPKFRVGEYKFIPAKQSSANAGCLYVLRGAEYLGKINGAGSFFASREATEQDKADIARIGADPLAAAVMHGKQTGNCSCCGRLLENEESVSLGIGPICRQKWGL
jgi:hypothetical protein